MLERHDLTLEAAHTVTITLTITLTPHVHADVEPTRTRVLLDLIGGGAIRPLLQAAEQAGQPQWRQKATPYPNDDVPSQYCT